MQYNELDINGKINMKGTYEQFLNIAVERFQQSQEKKIYGRKSKKGTRSRSLFNSFKKKIAVSSAGGADTLSISFLMYGRFVDMGVGRGANMNHALLRKRYSLHRPDVPRQPMRWYTKTKASQEKRLAELLAQRYGQGLVKLSETLLNNTLTIPL